MKDERLVVMMVFFFFFFIHNLKIYNLTKTCLQERYHWEHDRHGYPK